MDGDGWPEHATSGVCMPTSATAKRPRSLWPFAPQELFEQAEGVLDTSDIERVHDMRVATRRLRAVLEIFAPASRARRCATC